MDEIIKVLAYDGKISITCANTTNLVELARKTHDLSPVATSAFGRLLTILSLMGVEMKNENDKLTIQLKGNGPLGAMVVVTNNKPEIKGYVTNPQIDLPLDEFGKIDVSTAVGNQGYINVIKDIGLKKPYIGISPIVTGEIGDDFAKYFVESEQRKSAVGVGVLLNAKGVKSSGGYLINAMPDAKIEDIDKLEKAIFEAGAISKLLEKDLTLLEIAKKITGDNNEKVIEQNIRPEYKCDCSKEKMENAIASIGKEELEKIIMEDEKAELVCHFCNKKYNFTKEQLENILLNNTKK